jgi:hypothetical protein
MAWAAVLGFTAFVIANMVMLAPVATPSPTPYPSLVQPAGLCPSSCLGWGSSFNSAFNWCVELHYYGSLWLHRLAQAVSCVSRISAPGHPSCVAFMWLSACRRARVCSRCIKTSIHVYLISLSVGASVVRCRRGHFPSSVKVLGDTLCSLQVHDEHRARGFQHRWPF